MGKPRLFFYVVQLDFKSAVERKRHLRKPEMLNSLLSSTRIKYAKGIKATKQSELSEKRISYQTSCSTAGAVLGEQRQIRRTRWRVRKRTGQGGRRCRKDRRAAGPGCGGKAEEPACSGFLPLPPVNRAHQEPRGLRVGLFLNPSPSPWETMKKTELMNTKGTCFFEDRET